MLIPKTDVIITCDGEPLARYIVEPGEYIIGRSTECGLHIVADLVSRLHAKLTVHDDHLVIEDLGSSNGTFVNGRPVTEPVRLWPNQKVSIGVATLEFKRQREHGDSTQSIAPRVAAVRQILPDEFLRERKYEIGGLVAQGGMGAVLNAREATTERTIAMKVMLDNPAPDDVARFINEAKITGQLEHPNIVPVHELGVDENEQVFYTMKFVRGITLKKILELIAAGVPQTIRKYSLGNLLTVFQKVCDAIAFAHSKGVIHRDLKPENIMIGDFGEVLVMDWGIAKLVGASRAPSSAQEPARSMIRSVSDSGTGGSFTMAGAIMGTPQYMSPEQARGEVETLDTRADIYSLGAILYHILALRPPVEGDDPYTIVERVARGEIDPLDDGTRRPGAQSRTPTRGGSMGREERARRSRSTLHLAGARIPDSLAAVVRKAMAFDPAERYAAVPALQHEIEAFQNGFATSAERAGFVKQMLLLLKRNKGVAIPVAIVAALAVAFAVNVFISQQRLKSTFAQLRKAAPTFHAQALALIEESPGRPAALDEALENIDHAIDLAPQDADFRTTRGHILQTLQRFKEARAAFVQALHRNSQQRSARENLALCDALLQARGASGELSPDTLSRFQAALQQQGRLPESLVLLSRSGAKDKTRIAAAWAAVLKKAGIDRTPTVFDDGLLGVYLGGLQIDDLSFLKGMPIADLSLPEGTGISDLTPLAGMPLRRLWSPRNNVRDLSPLSGMPLKELVIASTQVTDLSPLRGMPLEILQANGAIDDFSVLRELPLKSLTITNCRVRDLAVFQGLKLTHLFASTNPFADLSPLKGMPLEALDINNCGNLRDLTPLAGMPLKKLTVAQCARITDLEPLRGCPLEDLDLNQTAVTDLRPLAGAPLRLLGLGDTRLADLDQLKTFAKLEYLNLDRAPITDLKPLAGLGIQSLDLRNTLRLKDVDQLTGMPALKAVALPLHLYKVSALRNKPGLVWIGYGSVPKPAELTGKTQTAAEFWTMNDLELQLRGADPKGLLHTAKFPHMERRFPTAKPFERHWYRPYNIAMSWSEADRFAVELGGHLATITSPQEDEFVRKNAVGISGGRSSWIGARADAPGGPWRWVTGEPWRFERWGRNSSGPIEPDGVRKPSSEPDLFVGYFNQGGYSNSPAWNDLPDQSASADSMVIEWEE